MEPSPSARRLVMIAPNVQHEHGLDATVSELSGIRGAAPNRIVQLARV